MALVRTPRHVWVDAGLAALATGGPEAIRIEALARRLSVTKGGFYWHFADRHALLEAVLDTWQQRCLDEVIATVEHEADDARTRLRRLFSLGADTSLRRIDVAVRLWAREDDSVAQRLEVVDRRRWEFMRGLFGRLTSDRSDIEARCLVAMSLFVAGGLLDTASPDQPEVMHRVTQLLL